MSALHISIVRHVIHAAHVIRDLQLTIKPGEIFCLLGPSGCGKSTTLRLTAGLDVLQYGEIAIADRILTGEGVSVPPEDRHIGIVFQHPALFPHLTLRRNVMFGLSAKRDAVSHAQHWLEKVGLGERALDYPHRLSGGEQQRVALARALAPNPQAILLDEPFASLDHALRGQLRGEIHSLLKSTGKPTLLVSHDREDALHMADRIGVMDHGKLVQQGTAEHLYNNPATPFVAGLFGEVNQLRCTVQGGIVDTPLGSYPAPDIPSGSACSIAIRPEHLTLHNTAPKEKDECTTMQVTQVQFAGQHWRVTLRHDPSASSWVAHAHADDAPECGETVYLHPAGDKIMLFPEK